MRRNLTGGIMAKAAWLGPPLSDVARPRSPWLGAMALAEARACLGRGDVAEASGVGHGVDVAVADAQDVDRAGAGAEVAQAVADGFGGDGAGRPRRLGQREAQRQMGGERGRVRAP